MEQHLGTKRNPTPLQTPKGERKEEVMQQPGCGDSNAQGRSPQLF